MKKNVLLIGIGAMGTSHLKSFNNKKNCKIYIYDKYLKKSHIKKKIDSLELNINYEICEFFPKNKIFSAAIFANHSIDRFKTVKAAIKNNKIRLLLLEKFIFLKKKHFDIIKKIFNIKKILVNTWGGIILNLSKLNFLRSVDFKIFVLVPEGSLLTNLIHIYYFFSLLTKNKIEIQKKIYKIIKSKRKQFHELKGSIFLKSLNKSMEIKTCKNLKNIQIYKIYYSNKKIILKIGLQGIYKQSIRIANFPTASLITYKNIFNFENKCKNKNLIMPTLKKITDISIRILNNFSRINKRKILIN
jgi:hypothetical protein